MVDRDLVQAAYKTALCDLLQQRGPSGSWVGELSSSALSTATATSALALVKRHAQLTSAGRYVDEVHQHRTGELIAGGLRWLASRQNADGGWGDTDKSVSNIATTMLVRAAFHLSAVPAKHANLMDRAEHYIEAQGGIPALRRRYGKDKTFAAPILANYALAGLASWREVPSLPFELACLSRPALRFLHLPVVSYAVPALVAIGQVRYFHRKPLNPVVRLVRSRAVEKSLRVLGEMQPPSGGYLEAVPLTSFVVMSLASMGLTEHAVTRRGVEFLSATVRPDGSWPIDTNLATWNTTLAVNALAGAGEEPCGRQVLDWLLGCQHRQEHPFTGAAPGGWGWNDAAGAVPDADDTAGAILALATWRKPEAEAARASREDREPWAADSTRDAAGLAERDRIDQAVASGVKWLLDLQNSDGGWPTFCRGWGTLPFDRSGVDLTAHVLRAFKAWRRTLAASDGGLPGPLAARDARIGTAMDRGVRFLIGQQRADGSWTPLWFGNQFHPAEENPVYGTGRALLAFRDLGLLDTPAARRGLAWLARAQNRDGGWGGGPVNLPRGTTKPRSSVEETAVAVEALLAAKEVEDLQPVIRKGLAWLLRAVESDVHQESSPIGLYFAKLWYHERLYPLIFTVSALGRAIQPSPPQAEPKPIAAHLGNP
ncbi:MAG: prenyltransferase/squalene oxidase repeat-containing protein [Pirellulales bacterium]